MERGFAQTLSGEQFFLWQEGEFLIFATNENMRLLAEVETIYVDSRFEICPRVFYQVFTINAFIHGQQFPLVYRLLPGKLRETYNHFVLSSQIKSWLTLSLYSHLSFSFQVLIFMAVTLILHNAYGDRCRDLAWWRSTKRMHLSGDLYRKGLLLLLSHPHLSVSLGMELKWRCLMIK